VKTVVFQSYRTNNVPHWIVRCMESVRQWAALRDHEYRFYDDDIFDLLPSWYRNALNGRMLPMADLARLKAAGKLLSEGIDRVIWIDADIVVFDPHSLFIDARDGFAVCPEIWIRKQWGAPVSERRVNNAVLVFDRGNPFLDFYMYATEARVRSGTSILTDWAVGPEFLTALNAVLPLPCIDGVGLFSPLVLHGIANEDAKWVERYSRDFGRKVYAANLCGSAANKQIDDVSVTDDLYHAVIDVLVESRGSVVNRHLLKDSGSASAG
jgi:hypothetical protein